MPRGGPPTYQYSLPAIYLAVPGTTILAVQHNAPLEDIEDVLNDPWPVIIGGTGGTSAITAWDSINVRGTDIATAATLDVDSATGPNVHLTGAVTVTAVSLGDGNMRFAVADSAFLMTASASLVVNGLTSGSQPVAVNSELTFIGGAAGVVYVYVTGGAGSGTQAGYTTTATAAGTTTLTVSSTLFQYFTGSTTQTITMPVTSTLSLGQRWIFVNNSTGALTINSSGANLIATVASGDVVTVQCILLSGTTAASWNYNSPRTITSTDAGATAGPIFVGDRFSASPAASDIIRQDISRGRNSIGGAIDYAYTETVIGSPTSTDEHGIWRLWLASAFTSATYKMIEATGPSFSGVPITSALDLYSNVTVKINGSQSDGSLAVEGLVNISGSSAGQIKFPATQNPSANANTLDDYEEATWTPGMTFNGSATGVTYGTQSGRLTKVGDRVAFDLQITLTNNGSGVGTALVTNLTFTALSGLVASAAAPIAGFTGLTAGICAFVQSSATTINLRAPTTTGATILTDTEVTNTANFLISGSYSAA